jgi:hypothetical protein
MERHLDSVGVDLIGATPSELDGGRDTHGPELRSAPRAKGEVEECREP